MSAPPDPPNLDALLDRALKVGGETEGFDFKELLDFQKNGEHKLRLLKAIGAFCNTDKGGHIIIGVTNDGRVVGISSDLAQTYDQTPIQRLAGEYFAPQPVLQVRRHQRDGKELVFIDVSPFKEIPCIVKRYEVQGKEKLQDGTFLVRSGSAESGLLRTEVELRKLCDAITARRAQTIMAFIGRGSGADPAEERRASLQRALRLVKVEADRIGEHARNVNIELQSHSGRAYLPLLFRPALLESTMPQIIELVQTNPVFQQELGVLRGAAAAADEQTLTLLERGGDARGLVQLVLTVLHTAASVSREAERLLKT